jgi:hypothetical protein
MPMTDVESAGGGLGPPAPMKFPPAAPPSTFRALLSPTGLPAVNENGCTHGCLMHVAIADQKAGEIRSSQSRHISDELLEK